MFRTELTIAPQERQLARTARVLTVGSCFADSIGERLRLNKVTTLVNPFGTVFQPLALAQLLRAAAGEAQDWQQHVVEARGRWQSYDFHSTIGAESPVELLQTIQETVRRVGDFVQTADTVLLTLGTAWAYRLRETGELVSNLHKLPAALFEKELLTADEIVNGLAEVHALLRRINPAIRIVLTVSPVRHIKDTLPLNAVSKSVLRVACHYLSELLPGVSYFPAYELLNDELRDYRFYGTDMLHPSEVAEDYIWDKFARAYFDADFGRFRKEWAAVRQSLGHRPLHLGAPEHRTFLDQTRERLERLSGQGVDVRQELRDVQRQLAALPPPKPVRVPEVETDDEERIDIGDDTVATARLHRPEEAASLRPERQRQDGRRDNRRNDRNSQDRRDSRHQPASIQPAEPAQLLPDLLPEESAAIEMPVAETQASAVPTEENETTYPAKKKKRRSRGGAKRTARKHAARLAEEQGTGLAETELLEELAQEATGVALETDNIEISGYLGSESIPASLGEPQPDEPRTAVATAEPSARKRGAGPTPKKSKVITKSGIVKRGRREGLYRVAEPSATLPAAGEPTFTEALPATAPIISPPIIPVALLERPAIADAMETPPAEFPAPAVASEPVAAAAPLRPRRGRPKAAAPQPPAVDETPTPVPVVSPEIPARKAASRPGKPARTAKPAAAKKPATTKKAVPKKAAARTATPPRRRATRTTPPPDEAAS
ncbi:GSCFA domain-containing protein [Hymenobacter baengnokdamensis]|uniref:GSCFA domain-containing protein n=1 Tax=Hymenobacter baengnokdamensis TaxID=2615203 RepID=UPI001245F22B|nr:GSCFA domain-containing protein [Hymenobacter baengnokdamensis]